MTNKPTILIVGASRGLGLALVEQFCSRDWHVIGTVRGKSAALDDLKARFPGSLRIPTKPAIDSDRNQPPVPIEASQAFRRKPAGVVVWSEGGDIRLRS